jgi:hypothetical protein
VSTALNQLLENPAGLTERQVNELRSMVMEAKRVLDDQAMQQRFVETVHAQHQVIFETLDGLKASEHWNVTREGGGIFHKIRRPMPRSITPLDQDQKPCVVESIPIREYMFSRWVTGRFGNTIPVYSEVLR